MVFVMKDEDRRPFRSSCYVRCPACGHQDPAADCDGIYATESGRTYDTVCPNCGRCYDVLVETDVVLESPALDADERHEQALGRIHREVQDRRAAGAPGVPSAPVEGVPYVAPKVPPGKVHGASARRLRKGEVERMDLDDPDC